MSIELPLNSSPPAEKSISGNIVYPSQVLRHSASSHPPRPLLPTPYHPSTLTERQSFIDKVPKHLFGRSRPEESLLLVGGQTLYYRPGRPFGLAIIQQEHWQQQRECHKRVL